MGDASLPCAAEVSYEEDARYDLTRDVRCDAMRDVQLERRETRDGRWELERVLRHAVTVKVRRGVRTTRTAGEGTDNLASRGFSLEGFCGRDVLRNDDDDD